MTDMGENVDKPIQEQQARAKLRESFLRAVIELNGRQCNILTYEKTSLRATFEGWKPDDTEILVKNLETPSGVTMNSALLRIPDILAIQFEGPL